MLADEIKAKALPVAEGHSSRPVHTVVAHATDSYSGANHLRLPYLDEQEAIDAAKLLSKAKGCYVLVITESYREFNVTAKPKNLCYP